MFSLLPRVKILQNYYNKDGKESRALSLAFLSILSQFAFVFPVIPKSCIAKERSRTGTQNGIGSPFLHQSRNIKANVWPTV